MSCLYTIHPVRSGLYERSCCAIPSSRSAFLDTHPSPRRKLQGQVDELTPLVPVSWLSEHELPPKRLLKAYRKLHLYAPRDLGYLLACKLMAGRREKDVADIAVLCQTLAIQRRAQAQQIVDQYFPSPAHQATYRLPRTLESTFGK